LKRHFDKKLIPNILYPHHLIKTKGLATIILIFMSGYVEKIKKYDRKITNDYFAFDCELPVKYILHRSSRWL
ncbi:TPA: hypothetical protein ACP2TB_004074, partial [Escherichia coli]